MTEVETVTASDAALAKAKNDTEIIAFLREEIKNEKYGNILLYARLFSRDNIQKLCDLSIPTLCEFVLKDMNKKFCRDKKIAIGILKEIVEQRPIENRKESTGDEKLDMSLGLIKKKGKIQAKKEIKEGILKGISEKAAELPEGINFEKTEWEKYIYPKSDDPVYYAEYKADAKTIWKEQHGLNKEGEPFMQVIPVSRTPFIICGKSKALEDGTVYYTIRHGKHQNEFTVPKSKLSPRQVLKTTLAQYDINVTDEIVKETEEYISIYLYAFGDKLRVIEPILQNGWNEDCTLFAMGKRGITIDGEKEIHSIVTNPKHSTVFHTNGTEKGWIDASKDLMSYDITQFLFFDAMVAPLLKPLNMESHVTTHYGSTSRGKTLIEREISSTMGNYKMLEFSANSTKNAIIAHAAAMNDMPIDIEEATSEKSSEVVADTAYDIANGEERGRCQEAGELRDIKTFRVIAHVTCERPLREKMDNAGALFRLNEIEELLPKGLGEMTNRAKGALLDNYGFFFPRYLRHIMKEKESLKSLYERAYSKIEINYESVPEDSKGTVDRSRFIFAGVTVAGYLCNDVMLEMGMPKEVLKNKEEIEKLVSRYFEICVLKNPVESNHIRALRIVSDWVAINKANFINEETEHKSENEIKGKAYGLITDEAIEIIGTQFNAIMKEYNFSPSEIKKTLVKEGVISSSRPDGTKTQAKLGTSVVYIKRKQMKAIINNNEKDEKFENNSLYPTMVKVLCLISTISQVNRAAEPRILKEILGSEVEIDRCIEILEFEGKIRKNKEGKYVNY